MEVGDAACVLDWDDGCVAVGVTGCDGVPAPVGVDVAVADATWLGVGVRLGLTVRDAVAP